MLISGVSYRGRGGADHFPKLSPERTVTARVTQLVSRLEGMFLPTSPAKHVSRKEKTRGRFCLPLQLAHHPCQG